MAIVEKREAVPSVAKGIYRSSEWERGDTPQEEHLCSSFLLTT